MIFVIRVVDYLVLKVKNSMIMKIHNKGVVYLANNWKMFGRTRHVEVCQCFLRDLKEPVILKVVLITEARSSNNLFDKNLPQHLFEKHIAVYFGVGEYMNKE